MSEHDDNKSPTPASVSAAIVDLEAYVPIMGIRMILTSNVPSGYIVAFANAIAPFKFTPEVLSQPALVAQAIREHLPHEAAFLERMEDAQAWQSYVTMLCADARRKRPLTYSRWQLAALAKHCFLQWLSRGVFVSPEAFLKAQKDDRVAFFWDKTNRQIVVPGYRFGDRLRHLLSTEWHAAWFNPQNHGLDAAVLLKEADWESASEQVSLSEAPYAIGPMKYVDFGLHLIVPIVLITSDEEPNFVVLDAAP